MDKEERKWRLVENKLMKDKGKVSRRMKIK